MQHGFRYESQLLVHASSLMLKLIRMRRVEPSGTSVPLSNPVVKRQIVASVHTTAACTVEHILEESEREERAWEHCIRW